MNDHSPMPFGLPEKSAEFARRIEEVKEGLRKQFGPSVPATSAVNEALLKSVVEMRAGKTVIPVPDRERDIASKVFTGGNSGLVRLSLEGGASLRLRLDLSIVRLLAEMGILQISPQIEMKQR